MTNILITGGAGFIGSHLCDELIKYGYRIRVLDNLSRQVHGEDATRPDYLPSQVDLIRGDIRDKFLVAKLVKEADAVFHFASLVGVGQSMYQLEEYTDVNVRGTANLLESIIQHPVRKLIVASSMSIYGEGMYQDRSGNLVQGSERPIAQLKMKDWELTMSERGVLTPLPTPETKSPSLSSVYALTKYDQERLCLMIGNAYNIPTVGLRFFNVYGTRQALSNPYTGVMAIFSSRLLNDRPPKIFEDGEQQRDFIHVSDLTRACRLALESKSSSGEVFNIGSGKAYTVRSLARLLAETMGKSQILPEITGEYRVGDIRHCFADITKAKTLLGFQPAVSIENGMRELVDWLENQLAVDLVDQAAEELKTRGLTV
nr:NAD-dependent epimerase/dehydratase family protein [Cytophagales bacterium]